MTGRLRNLDLLRPPAAPPITQSALWATVTQASPLRIQLDSDTSALDVTPDSLVAGLVVGDRVWCQLTTNTDPQRRSRRLVVVGKASNVGSGWAAYTPSLIGSTTNPTLGTGGSISGAWRMDQDGTVDGYAAWQFGTGLSVGSGNYRIGLPTPITAPLPFGAGANGLSMVVGQGHLRDDDGGTGTANRHVYAFVAATSGGPGGVATAQLAVGDGTTAFVTSAGPIPWAANDGGAITFRYRSR